VGKLVLVCAGGALGSGARYLVAMWATGMIGPELPAGTLLVNVIGSFLIAVVIGLSLGGTGVSPNLRLFLTSGVMGGFTTYSAFTYETLRLLDEGNVAVALMYLGSTVLGCLGAGFVGLASVRLVARLAGRAA
jgi:CrcB protein